MGGGARWLVLITGRGLRKMKAWLTAVGGAKRRLSVNGRGLRKQRAWLAAVGGATGAPWAHDPVRANGSAGPGGGAPPQGRSGPPEGSSPPSL